MAGVALDLWVPDRCVWVRMWILAAALSVLCVGYGVASLPHNYPWILASQLASASAFSSEIKASLGVLVCTQPSLISGSPILVWRCVLLGAEGPGLPLGSRMWFPRLCGLSLSTLSCFWLPSATTFSHPWVWQGAGTAVMSRGRTALASRLANLGALISLGPKLWDPQDAGRPRFLPSLCMCGEMFVGMSSIPALRQCCGVFKGQGMCVGTGSCWSQLVPQLRAWVVEGPGKLLITLLELICACSPASA